MRIVFEISVMLKCFCQKNILKELAINAILQKFNMDNALFQYLMKN